MSAKSAIREERKKIGEQIETLKERLAKLEGKDEALAQAERVLSGRTNGRPSRAGGRGPDRQPKISKEALAEEILGVLKRNPRKEFNAHEMKIAVSRAHSSAQNAMEFLVRRGAATLVKRGPKGGPVVRYKETSVHAGEGVRS